MVSLFHCPLLHCHLDYFISSFPLLLYNRNSNSRSAWCLYLCPNKTPSFLEAIKELNYYPLTNKSQLLPRLVIRNFIEPLKRLSFNCLPCSDTAKLINWNLRCNKCGAVSEKEMPRRSLPPKYFNYKYLAAAAAKRNLQLISQATQSDLMNNKRQLHSPVTIT